MDIRPVSPSAASAPQGAERDTAVRSAAPAKPSAAVRDDAAALEAAVSKINKSLQASSQGVEFSIDDDSKRLVVKVVDQETREVLRQMPSAEALAIARALDRTQGMLIRHEA